MPGVASGDLGAVRVVCGVRRPWLSAQLAGQPELPAEESQEEALTVVLPCPCAPLGFESRSLELRPREGRERSRMVSEHCVIDDDTGGVVPCSGRRINVRW